MIQSGLSLPRLRSVHAGYNASSIVCYVNDEEVAEKARQSKISTIPIRHSKAKSILHGGLAVFGNSPIALLELNRLILEEQSGLPWWSPCQSASFMSGKQRGADVSRHPLYCIGWKTGREPPCCERDSCPLFDCRSPRKGDPFGKANPLTTEIAGVKDEAIILMGHGSRVPEAGKDMEEVARRLKEKYGYPRVEICSMSGLGPRFPRGL